MSISIGRGPRGWITAIPPKNQGVNDDAQRTLRNVIARANQQHANALSVDGIPLFIWTKHEGAGYLCTCRHATALAERVRLNQTQIPARIPDDEDGHVDIHKSSDVKVDIRRVRINRPLGESRFARKIQEYNDGLKKGQVVDNDEELSDAEVDSVYNESEIQGSADDKARYGMTMGGSIGSGEKGNCAICFGTGFTEAYKLHGGQKFILDASDANPFKLKGGSEIDRSTSPYTFTVPQNIGVWVEWTVTLPTYFRDVLLVHVRNNMYKAEGVKAQIHFGDNTWVDMTPDVLRARNTQATTAHIRVISLDDDPQSSVMLKFTHVEWSYTYTVQPYGQMPHFGKEINYEMTDAMVQTNIEIGAAIPEIPRGSVISEGKYGFLWKAILVMNKKSAERQIYGHDVDVRMIQSIEQLYMLSLINKKDVEFNFRGLEQIQGGSSFEDTL